MVYVADMMVMMVTDSSVMMTIESYQVSPDLGLSETLQLGTDLDS